MLYEKNSLHYPFGLQWSPEVAEPFEVASGVYWLRMPLPIQLDHINLWLLRDAEQWTIVDTGMYDDGCKQAWEKVFSEFLSPASVNRIVITHYHPDHLGLASWLLERCNCKVLISRPEFDFYFHLRTRNLDDYADRAKKGLREAGIDEAAAERYIKIFGEVNSSRTLQAEECEFLDEGAELQIGGRKWRAVTGSGHSPLHMCWHAEQDGLMISGDQALPRISSNISVYVDSRNRDPLRNWLASCEKLKRVIPAATTIFPAHQEPFVGIAERMDQLIEDHCQQLDQLREALANPMSALEASEILFSAKLNALGRLLAVGETQAHINYLVEDGEVNSELDESGVRLYCLAAGA